jgi:hypothetical protein
MCYNRSRSYLNKIKPSLIVEEKETALFVFGFLKEYLVLIETFQATKNKLRLLE